jgi:hypothetical protein
VPAPTQEPKLPANEPAVAVKHSPSSFEGGFDKTLQGPFVKRDFKELEESEQVKKFREKYGYPNKESASQ